MGQQQNIPRAIGPGCGIIDDFSVQIGNNDPFGILNVENCHNRADFVAFQHRKSGKTGGNDVCRLQHISADGVDDELLGCNQRIRVDKNDCNQDDCADDYDNFKAQRLRIACQRLPWLIV